MGEFYKVTNLLGKRFGKLVVTGRAENDVMPSGQIRVRWICKCDCGRDNNYIAFADRLKDGSIYECGYCTEDKYNLVGKTFGKLTVVKCVYKNDLNNRKMKPRSKWLCQCSCNFDNNTRIVDASKLIAGKVTQCAKCSVTQNHEDLTGHTFGYLKVLGRSEYPNGKYYTNMWDAGCRCGKIISVERSKLTSGTKTNCGCMTGLLNGIKHQKQNKFVIDGKIVHGWTNKDIEFIFDLDDFDAVKENCWTVNNSGYLTSYDKKNNNYVLLERFIMGLHKGDKRVVDHKNHDKKDNRKENLRIVTRSQNMFNQAPQERNEIGITGVNFDKRRNAWRSQLIKDDKVVYEEYFENVEDAIKARKEAEIKYFGEYRYKPEEDTRK